MKRIIQLLCMGLLLSACNMPGQTGGEALSVMIVEPVNGTQLEVGQLVDVHSAISYPDGEFTITLLVNGSTSRSAAIANPMRVSDVYQPWTPEAPGEYTLQTILDWQGQTANSNIVTVIVLESISLPDIPVKNTPTQFSTPPTPTDTLMPATEEARVTADQNVNCRKGPSSAYNDVGALYQGETAPILGRNPDTTWYYVGLSGTKCWVWSGAVTVIGNAGAKPVVAAPPLPITDTPIVPTGTPVVLTETPVPAPVYSACHDYPDLATCNTDPMGFGTCSWDTGMNLCKP
ncbi:MAG: SH3 domain-containing protein [Anaerolineales bacterium]|nr:SH3 domain-containing protein [Anaerolineales bacterium]